VDLLQNRKNESHPRYNVLRDEQQFEPHVDEQQLQFLTEEQRIEAELTLRYIYQSVLQDR
jgi:predicted 2-oxoglutarate/Fe(II)-dependent dioxygenase YbiX